MRDLIKREDAIATIGVMYERCDTYDITDYRDLMLEAVKVLPSADRPQGEWIYCEDEYGIDGYRCSNCGRHIPWDYQHKFINFIDDYHTCPFCDARMKGADDE